MIAESIQAVLRDKGHSPSAVVQTIENHTLQVSCGVVDEFNVETVMRMIVGWEKIAETRENTQVFKTYRLIK